MKVIREKRGANGDALVFAVEHTRPGIDHSRYRFRVTQRNGGAGGIDAVLLSKYFYASVPFEGYIELEVMIDAVRKIFDVAFDQESARMDADDAADAIDKLLSKHDTNTNS